MSALQGCLTGLISMEGMLRAASVWEACLGVTPAQPGLTKDI